MASRDASGVANSICLAKQADLEAVAFSCTGRRLARAAYGLGFRVWVFQSAAVPTRARGGSGHLGAADPTPATQTTAFFGFRALYPPQPPYQGGLHLESPRWPGWDVLTAAVA